MAAQISWGSANGCAQNIRTDNFGALTPSSSSQEIGPFDATPHALASIDPHGEHVWVGCVTANTELASVTASGLHDMKSAGDTLPLSDVYIGLTNSTDETLDGGQAGCAIDPGQTTLGACPLPVGSTQQALLTGVDPGTTELNWQYQLELSPNQPTGTYTGGEVIFTATAGEASAGQAPSNLTPPRLFGEAFREGEALTASHGTWTNTPTGYSYEWQQCAASGDDCQTIPQASGSSYTPAATDVGQVLRVIVTASNASGSASASSAFSPTIAAGAPSNTAPPVITGEPMADQTLSASTGEWKGTPTILYSYQWEICDGLGQGCLSIQGATGHTYTPNGDQTGSTLRVTVTAENTAGSSSSASRSAGPIKASSCSATWTGAADNGIWEDPRNWSADKTPDGSDHVCILTGETVTATGEDKAGWITDNGPLQITSGTLTVNGPSPSTIAALVVQRGTLAGAGEVDVEESLSAGGYGTMRGPGTTLLEANATGTITPTPGTGLYLEGRILNNAGTLTLTPGSGISGWAHAQILNTGTLQLNGENAGEGHGLFASPEEALLKNSGKIEKTEGSGGLPVGFAIQNEGGVNVRTGQLEFTGGTAGEHPAGTWSASGADTSIVFRSSGPVFHLGTKVSMSGAIEIAEGLVTASAIEGQNASLTLSGAAYYARGILEAGGQPSKLHDLAVQHGELTGPGEVDVSGSFSGGSYGSLSGSGSTVIEAGAKGSITPTGGSGLYLEGRTLVNAGELTLEKGSGLQGSRHTHLLNSGTLVLNGENAGENHGLIAGEGEATLTNTGTVTKTEGSGSIPVEFAVDNESMVTVAKGKLEFTGGGSSGTTAPGSWAADSGAGIVFNTRDWAPFSLGASVPLSGNVEIPEGLVTAGEIEGSSANVVIDGRGTLEVTDALEPSTLADLTVYGGVLGGAGEVDVTSSFTGGGYGWMTGTGSTVIEPSATGTIAGQWLTLEGRSLVNMGTLTIPTAMGLGGQRGAHLLNGGAMTVNGETAGENHGLFGSGNEASLTNTGTITKTEGTGITVIGWAIDNEGTVEAQTGTLEFRGGGANGGAREATWAATGEATKIVFNANRYEAGFSLGASTSFTGAVEDTEGTVDVGTIHGPAASLTTSGRAEFNVTGTDGPSTLAELAVQGGTLGGAGEVDVAQRFTGGGYGWITGGGTVTLEPAATGEVEGGTITLAAGRSLVNQGTFTIGLHGGIDGQQHARIANSGMLTVNGEDTGYNYGLIASVGEAELLNTGTLKKTAGTNTTAVGYAVDNEGTILVETGKLQLEGGGNSGQLTTDTWSATAGASIAFDDFFQAKYSLGANVVLAGSVSMDSSVTAGTINGANTDLTSELGNLTLTGLTPSTLHSLTFAQPEPNYYNEQRLQIASELHVASSVNWASNDAFFTEGALVAEPGSTTLFDPSAWVQIRGGQFINEGTATWTSGGLQANESSTFFINRGTFQANQDGGNPFVQGCNWEGEDKSKCPTFENDGTFTAALPTTGFWPGQILWRVDLVNYGKLEVPYEIEPECKWEYSEVPGPGAEACYRAIREFKGLLLQEGANVYQLASCQNYESEPCIEGHTEPDEEEGEDERALASEYGSPFATNEDCKRSTKENEHCYALAETPPIPSTSGFAGSSVEIEPTCMATNGDNSNFTDDEMWVAFGKSSSGENDWTEAGTTVGSTRNGGYSYPEYFVADNRSQHGYEYREHNSGVRAPLDHYFRDTIWHLGGSEWEAWTPGIHFTSSPQNSSSDSLQAGTEDTANDVSTEALIRKFEYEKLGGGWHTGWGAAHQPMVGRVTPNSTGVIKLISSNSVEVSFNSRSC